MGIGCGDLQVYQHDPLGYIPAPPMLRSGVFFVNDESPLDMLRGLVIGSYHRQGRDWYCGVSLAGLTLASGLVSALAWKRNRAARRRARIGHCPCCGYDLAGTTTDICPECGVGPV